MQAGLHNSNLICLANSRWSIYAYDLGDVVGSTPTLPAKKEKEMSKKFNNPYETWFRIIDNLHKSGRLGMKLHNEGEYLVITYYILPK